MQQAARALNPGIALRVLKAKRRAAWRLSILIATFYLKFILIGAVITSAILSLLFNLNGPMLFAGSLVAFTFLAFLNIPFKRVWKAELFSAYQFEKLWSHARAVLSEGSSNQIEDILQGKSPEDCDRGVLAQEIYYWIRKGDLRKWSLLAEYQAMKSLESPDLYYVDTRTALYMETGKYHEGQALALNWLAQLDAEGRSKGGAYISSLLALIDGYHSLRKKTELAKMLDRLREVVEGDGPGDAAESLIRSQCGSEIEWSFYWLYSGRLHLLHGELDQADIELTKAKTLMSCEHNNRVIILLYPEILLTIAELCVGRNSLVEAEHLIEEAIEYYHSATCFEGLDYVCGKAFLAYVRMKRGKSCSVQDIESALNWLKEQVEPLHPETATCLVYLGEWQRQQGEFDQARASWESALKIRQELFSTDSSVKEVEKLLLSLLVDRAVA
ncbi:MAG: tetratricopeptide repeat protein [Candidatus Obscuribacterales bacterium]|nr:tetratricopeptide repeat protein [Candidatus Obscuribacterales bacterium]